MSRSDANQHREARAWRLGVPCPHCGQRSSANKKRLMSDVLMEVVYSCSNLMCGHIFVVQVEAVRTLVPSAMPNPTVLLPISQHVRRALISMQMERSPVASAPEPDAPRNQQLDLLEVPALA